MSMTTTDATMTQTLVSQVYEQLFGDIGQQFDLYEGVIVSRANTRIVYLSADIIKGIHEALSYEAGDAWRIILKNCGTRWGKRIASTFDKELRSIANRRLDALTVTEYIELLESYFSLHGWGRLTINLSYAEQHGIIQCTLGHSIFSVVLAQVEGAVNCLIEGMLQGIFSTISQNDLLCLEIVGSTQLSPPENTFLITGRERLDALSPQIESGMKTADVLGLLT
ncbi:hypothetical protein FK216_01340 [Moraxellaceae bacterium AER2_44_116]|nr:hypothetical protein [Moraxellaceae bacterium]TQC99916.1 hypothetical protein FK216_01340 [Moraxellaceae bacterium AER2_44_116]